MRLNPCAREKEITELLHNGHWPIAGSPELRSHVNSCCRCSDLVLVTQVFRQARTESARVAPLDSPGVLWWRAQLRRRNAALERVSRPIAQAQLFALLVNLVVAVAFIAEQSRHGIRWLSWLSEHPQFRPFHVQTLWSLASMKPEWSLSILIPGLGALALLGGVALYLVSERE